MSAAAGTVQGGLWELPPAPRPDLAAYDVIVANISGGKDSQTMLRRLVADATAAGVAGRIVAVFADLGAADEWPGVPELAAEHAATYGLRFETVTRADGASLTEYIERRGMWPSSTARYCTSDTKRGPVLRLVTRLVDEQRAAGVTGRRVRVLQVFGFRAEESPARLRLRQFYPDERNSNGRRAVDVWLPIHDMTEAEVWADIRASGVRSHPVYAEGMPRLSCRFCVLASESALVRAAQLDPEGARMRAGLEARMGHTFQNGRSMADIITLAERTPAAAPVANWEG